MLHTAIDQNDLPDAPIEALAQATVLLSPPPKNEDRRWLGLLYDEAARSCTASDRGDRLVDLVKATVAAVPPRDAGRGAVTFPESFVRYQLLDLAGRRRWHDLVLAAGRLAWLMNLDPAPEKDDRSLANFVAWAMAEGRLQAGEAVISEAADRVLHPLMAEPEHEATMLMAEFDASLRSGDGVRALELLTRQSLPAGLSVHRADEQLLLPLHLAIREQLRARPDLQRLLRERYEPLATMRLQRAAREGNADAIAAVAVQFHGTPAAASALVLLADRDLSAGNFYAAAARYKVALDGPGLANSAQVAAKHRLASAMAGEEAGSPVTQDIALPDGKVSATEFESIIATLLANRSRRPEWSAVRREPLAPPVSDYTATVLSTIRGGSNDEAWRLGEGGGRTVLAREGQLIVVDPRQGQILWSLNPPAKTRDTMSWAPPTPVVAANHLVLRHNFGAGQELACFDLERGRLLWHQKYDDGLTGDAALAEGSVYALSRRSSGATQELMLRRVSPENRTSAVAAPVVALREQSGGLCVAGPLVLKDLIVVQANGSLICLDLQGEVRWLRKLLYVPRQVDLVGQRPQPVVLPAGADTIVVLAPGCPQVLCIEVRTGQVLWSCFRPDARAILGPSERQVVLMTDRTVEGLDIATGRVTWRRGLGADAVGILSGPQRHVLLVTSVRNEKTKRSAWHMTWLSAKDGRTVASRSPGELDASPGQGLHTDGGVIYAPVRNGQIVLLKPK
jgi:outer membrane protein assembly factor BamB